MADTLTRLRATVEVRDYEYLVVSGMWRDVLGVLEHVASAFDLTEKTETVVRYTA